MATDPTTMPEDPIERTEDEFRSRMRARRDRDLRFQEATEDFDRFKRMCHSIALGIIITTILFLSAYFLLT